MYEVSTQVLCSCEADSEPCMCGSATLAIVPSSACMMVAIITTQVIIERRRRARGSSCEAGNGWA